MVAEAWMGQRASRKMPVVDPASGRELFAAPVAGADQVAKAVKTARDASARWADTPAAERGAALSRAADAVTTYAGSLATLTTLEMGKPLGDSAGGVAAGIGTLRQYAELGPLHGGRSLLGSPDATDLIVTEPRGVVAAITPWNDPVAVSCGLIGAALATGNTVVYKPSERTPATGWLLATVLADALPPGVLQLVLGDGTTGATLASGDIDVIAHVGSTVTGRAVATEARSGVKVLLENGGCDPLIVDETVDPVWAAGQAALGAFANAGQICVSVERIYVVESVAERFVTALVERATALRTGPGLEPATVLGPLVDHRLRDVVHRQVTAAVEAGAKLRCGGAIPPGPGSFYPATVLTDCTDDMAVVHEETFGPVAPVVVVDSFEQALDRAACSDYGLAATVLTADLGRSQRAWRRLPFGTVKINDVFGGAPGGATHPRRRSGQGYGYGPELLDEMTLPKIVHIAPPPATAR